MRIVKKGQTAILFSAEKNATDLILKENLEEMTELALSAGLHPIYKLKQSLRSFDPAFLIGVGKRRELEEKVLELKPHFVIFDHSLSGVQTRNLEKLFKIPVLDRTQLILEIFAQRAQSHEGKLQVELAQLMDQMPRMVGAWLGSLSRQGGGGASKGPGEKALEMDRRQAQNRVKRVKKKLEKVKENRVQHRHVRKKNKVPSFALIGYTNSGKSALLNCLTKSNVRVKSQAFMTLDPKTRKLFIPGTRGAVLTDTVGFIRRLPPHLISAFKATLEEFTAADILLHVVDISNPHINRHIKVNDLIEEFSWDEKPAIYVFNKTDIVSPAERIIPAHCENYICVSAKTGYNIDKLLLKMKKTIEGLSKNIELFFPKEKEYKIYDLARQAKILRKEEGSEGTLCYIKIPANKTSQWKEYLFSEKKAY